MREFSTNSIFVIFFAVLLAAFSFADSNSDQKDPLIGNWGGEHISLEITARGAKAEFDCAHAEINQKITLKKNRFDVSGTFVEEHGGPISLNDQPKGYTVRFVGQIKGRQMTLTVKRKDNDEIIETFTLTKGQEPELFKCR